ncbi:hypothetical protein AV530_009452 [Patagioenas fasciata monilis]|uniref:Uncharacterized protein n=1 Tax=Patagioenas fasciata monilis TaxID=372326 RepID=A0A1V4JVV2_PATFA|nr:hypothetical protein AV530_009452 [Patagioenas fasciata monilis]
MGWTEKTTGHVALWVATGGPRREWGKKTGKKDLPYGKTCHFLKMSLSQMNLQSGLSAGRKGKERQQLHINGFLNEELGRGLDSTGMPQPFLGTQHMLITAEWRSQLSRAQRGAEQELSKTSK